MSKRKYYIIVLMMVVLAVSVGIHLWNNYKISEALNPTQCWIDSAKISMEQLSQMNPYEDAKRNFSNGDYRFITTGHTFLSIALAKEYDKIVKYGSKKICIGSDVLRGKNEEQVAKFLAQYAWKYNLLVRDEINKFEKK